MRSMVKEKTNPKSGQWTLKAQTMLSEVFSALDHPDDWIQKYLWHTVHQSCRDPVGILIYAIDRELLVLERDGILLSMNVPDSSLLLCILSIQDKMSNQEKIGSRSLFLDKIAYPRILVRDGYLDKYGSFHFQRPVSAHQLLFYQKTIQPLLRYMSFCSKLI